MKNNTNYFSHDCNARDDDKIMLLRSEYGWEGYGIRWLMIEKLSEATGYKLLLSNKLVISKLYAANIDVINYLFDVGLLAIDGEYMFSPSLLNRMQLKTEKKIKQSEGGKKAMENRWKSKEESGDDKLLNKLLITSKVKESKVKENKELYGSFQNVKLSLEEIEKLKKNSNREKEIEKLSMYIASTGKKYASHYATILNWRNKDNPQTQTQKTSSAHETNERLRIQNEETHQRYLASLQNNNGTQ